MQSKQSSSDTASPPESAKETSAASDDANSSTEQSPAPKEIGGRSKGLEPTRYGDWEFKGRCIDF